MKIPVAKVVSLACVLASVGGAAESSAPSAPDSTKKTLPRIVLPSDAPGSKTKAAPGAKTGADAKAGGETKGAVKAEKNEEGKIDGLVIPRGKGFMGLQVVNSVFKLSFYDEKKKPVAPDVDRAALRWDPRYKVGEERTVLLPAADGKSLSSEKNIRPPYNFKLFMTLIKETDGQPPVNETFTVDFRQ